MPMSDLTRSFSEAPLDIDIQRSRFMRRFSNKTTFNQGDLVPILIDEVLPGDTVSLDMSSLVRMSTPIFPVMDNANIDVYFFFVPNRLTWEHWKEFCGENTTASWIQNNEYTIPQMKFTSSTPAVTRNSLSGYFGLPSSIINADPDNDTVSVSALPFRGYYLIWNEWFRDQNLQNPINVDISDADIEIGASLIDGYRFGISLLPVQRYADYFSTCLPAPQKGSPVLLPLGSSAPVYASTENGHGAMSTTAMKFVDSDNNPVVDSFDLGLYQGSLSGWSGGASGSPANTLKPDNLLADLSKATASTVNQLREAFAVQRLYERDALGGSRYREILKSHFGVTSPDARVQIPEYLGGFRQAINIDQVVQTSAVPDQPSPIGTVSGYSQTLNTSSVFTKSFVEHGYLFALACVRVEHSYSQGVERFWSRKRRFDFYYPTLANLGNMAVMKKEIFADGSTMVNDEVFGYQEAWADYRYKPNRLTGLFGCGIDDATGLPKSADLQSWTYGDFYSTAPTLSNDWIKEGNVNVANTLATSSGEDQFIADFYFSMDSVRPMPLYSIPGLIDHH